MPYIKPEDRLKFNTNYINPVNCGELNYVLTSVILGYIKTKGTCYQSYNDVLGALEGCKLELYRRQVTDYEDTKIMENGDV